MKLVISIPAFNEEKSIASVIKEIPRDIADEVKVVVIDDGSVDKTMEVAKEAGADEVISFKHNRGLGSAFRTALETALEMDADILVNVDADNQYDPKEIPQLIKPIIDEEVDMVLGSRFKGAIEGMSLQKRIGNILATKATSFASGFHISDAQTGFRAYSRNAILRLNMTSDYTYVQETIIQAAKKGLKITEIPCTFRRREYGDSRLISSMFSYAKNAIAIILRTYLRYRPLKVFLYVGGFIFLLGFLAGLRVLVNLMQTGQVGYYPSTILSAVLLIIGFQVIILGLLADLIDGNRRIQEEILYKLRRR
ncbi:MAG: glycosyltransferase family 2 protein [Candidatus Altiarchaeota archaeon]|nr:glycosyltransferase family 2 protein [Candidatus Altiarchaeota archaeon]